MLGQANITECIMIYCCLQHYKCTLEYEGGGVWPMEKGRGCLANGTFGGEGVQPTGSIRS